jgi:hypothetical protein
LPLERAHVPFQGFLVFALARREQLLGGHVSSFAR